MVPPFLPGSEMDQYLEQFMQGALPNIPLERPRFLEMLSHKFLSQQEPNYGDMITRNLFSRFAQDLWT